MLRFRQAICLSVLALWSVALAPLFVLDGTRVAAAWTAERIDRFQFWIDGTRPALVIGGAFDRCMNRLCHWCDELKPRPDGR